MRGRHKLGGGRESTRERERFGGNGLEKRPWHIIKRNCSGKKVRLAKRRGEE